MNEKYILNAEGIMIEPYITPCGFCCNKIKLFRTQKSDFIPKEIIHKKKVRLTIEVLE